MKHKRRICILLAALLFLLAGCTGQTDPGETTTQSAEETAYQAADIHDGVTKVLAIGNSFTVDTLEYVHQIARSAGVKDFVICKAVFPGASIDHHALYTSLEKGRYELAFNTDEGGWSFTLDRCLWEALEAENWDYVVIQQNSPNSGNPKTFGQLDVLVDYIRQHTHPDTQVVYHMTWAYQKGCTQPAFADYQKDQMVMYEAILSTIREVILSRGDITMVIPTGTAIQNARTSYIGDNMTLADGYHLNHQHGRYLAAMTFAAYMLGVDPDQVTYVPEGVSQQDRQVAAEAVKNALETPFAITPSTFTQNNP